MKEQIIQLRVKIDGLSQLTKGLKPINKNEEFKAFPEYINSKEIEKTYDSLILAKAWLGKVLQELGESTPYANDGNRKTVEDIEPTADKPNYIITKNIDTGCYDWDKGMNHIEKVDWLRQEIDIITAEVQGAFIRGYVEKLVTDIDRVHLLNKIIYQHLSEARFWLGFELQRIRESK
jgi:hypothetical protein